MSRRSRLPDPPGKPTGYRQTRRGSKAIKTAKRAETQHAMATGFARAHRSVRNVLIVIVQGVAIVAFALVVLLTSAVVINQVARWNAERLAARDAATAQERQSRENVVLIGADGAKVIGYLAIRVDRARGQAFGLAIPEGAFIDVPGQGFTRVGDAYKEGPEAVTVTISNFLGVPFTSYVVVPAERYRTMLTAQSLAQATTEAAKSNLTPEELSTLEAQIAKIPAEKVAILPLPVKQIRLGEQTYLEPQRDAIGDLLKSWWGIDPDRRAETTRVVVYNGAGKPGIAGEAAQQLIRAGMRVVDTQNADSFNYRITEIVVKRGDAARGEAVRKVLGVGTVSVEPSDANVTDVMVIIGKDYRPPKQ